MQAPATLSLAALRNRATRRSSRQATSRCTSSVSRSSKPSSSALALVDLNNRPFKKLPGCRRSAFLSMDAPALKPLPAARFAISRCKAAKVNIDYHVEFEGHYYSVPNRLVGAKVELRITGRLLECFASNQRVAGHAVSAVRGGLRDHTRAHAGQGHEGAPAWPLPRSPGMDAGQAHRVGAARRCQHRCGGDVATRAPPASGARLPRLPGPAGPGAAVLRRAAGGRLHTRHRDPGAQPAQRHQHLKSGLDRQPSLLPATDSPAILHENVRGADYYH